MNDLNEIENRIKKIKKDLTDYLEFTKVFEYPEEETEIRINLMLEDLKRLTDKRDELLKSEN